MSELVERLRAHFADTPEHPGERSFTRPLLSEAADRIAELEARVEVLVDVGNALAFAAGALNLATDGLPLLRGERVNVLDALKDWTAALNPSARSE